MNNCLFGFNGERIDPVSGHYHLGNGYRAYSPELMRFTCPDNMSPFGAGGINPYAYCAGDPVNRADPTGHHSFWGWFGIAAGVALGVLLTPVSGGSSLAVALSAISVTMAVASTGLAVAQQFVEESDPKAGAALGWAALGTGIASGLSSGVLSKVAPEAKSLAGLLKGTSNRPFGGLMMEGQNAGKAGSASAAGREWVNRGIFSRVSGRVRISEPQDLRIIDEENYPRFESNRRNILNEEYLSAQRAVRAGKIEVREISSLSELKETVTPSNSIFHKFVLSAEDKFVVNSVSRDDFELMSHQSLACMRNINSPVKTAGIIEADVGGFFRVSNHSGHYMPTASSLKHIERLLASWGSVPELNGVNAGSLMPY